MADTDEHANGGLKQPDFFSLPRELRDQVYNLVLHHEHIHEPPYHKRTQCAKGKASEKNFRHLSSAHTYRFHTSLLTVNRQLHEEASVVLKSNGFVVVSILWPNLPVCKHHLGVPIVTETKTHVARFGMHVLRVHFQASKFTVDLANGNGANG
jgi:hypothetical protein